MGIAREYAKKIQKYNATDTSMVNQAYIDSFIKDADSYFNTYESDFGKLNWGNAANAYNTRNQTWNDLTKRADAIGAWLYNNRNSMSRDTYDSYNKYLDSLYEGGRGIVDSFKNYSDYFGNWSSQEEYDKWYNDYQETQRMANSKEGKAGWQKYLSDQSTPKESIPWWQEAILRGHATSNDNPAVMAFNTAVYDYQRDESYRTPSDNWTDDERNVFGYYYATNPAKAFTYAADLNNQKNLEQEQKKMAEIVQNATSNFGSGTVNSLGALFAATTGLADTLNYLAMQAANRPITEDGFVSPFEYSQAVQSGISSKLNEMSGTLNVGGMEIGLGNLYGIGMSIAQSQIGGRLLGAIGTLVNFFGQGAAQGIKEAKQRGATDEQAILYGGLSGAFEGAAEMIGFDHMTSKLLSASDIKTVLKNLLAQSGAEGLEEGFTTIANTIADAWVLKDKSALQESVNELVASGMSVEEAENQVLKQAISQVIYDTVTGAISGSVSGGIESVVKTSQINTQFKEDYIKNPDSLKALLEGIALENPDTDTSALMEKYRKGEKISANELRKFVYANEQSVWNQDKSKLVDSTEKRLSELGEKGDLRKLAESIVNAQYGYSFDDAILDSEQAILNNEGMSVKDLSYLVAEYSQNAQNKQSLSRAEQKAIRNSEYGSRVSNELNPNMREETSSTWAQGVKTNRLGNTAENVAKTRAKVETLKALNDSRKNIPSPSFTYKSDVVAPHLKEKGAQAKENASATEYANVMGYRGTTNEAFSKYYKGEDLEKYGLAFNEAYEMGKQGIPKSELDNASFKGYANEEAIDMAYQSGVLDAKYEALKTEKIKVKGGATVTVPMSTKGLKESQKATIELMKVLAEVTNTNMAVIQSATNHGLYDPKTKTISVDINLGGRDFMITSLSHELTHHLARAMPEKFDEFARILFEEVGKVKSTKEAIEVWKKNNKKYYPKYTDAELNALAREEVVAEMCESFLTDEKVAQRISQKVYEADKGLWNTIKKWLEDFVAKIKSLFSDIKPQSENGRIVKEMGDKLDAVKQMWADMIVESGEITTEATQEQVKNSRKGLEKLDSDYLSAVERGDMETAQRMVDEAAIKAGYTVKGYHGSHNSFTVFDEGKSGLYGGMESRIGFWFGITKKGAENWANETWGTTENNPQVYDSWLKIKNPKIFVTKEADSEAIEKITKEIRSAENEYNNLYEELRGLGLFASWTVSDYIRTNGNSVIKNLHNIDESTFSEVKRIAKELVSCNEKIKQLRETRGELIFTDSYEQFRTEIYKLAGMDAEDANVGGLGRHINNGYEIVKKYRDDLISQGYDGIIIRDTRFDADTLGEGKKNEQIVVFAPNQIKSADPVTYDDDGNVIPLPQRFNEENEDIRYSHKNSVDIYTEKQYNDFGWVRWNNVISAGRWKNFTENFAQAVTGLQIFPKSNLDEFMIEVYDAYDPMSDYDAIVFAKGTIESPIITRIIKFNSTNHTLLEETRGDIYALEKRGIRQKIGRIFNSYSSTDFPWSANGRGNNNENARYNNQLGAKRRRSEIVANPIVRIRVDEETNTITTTYRNGQIITSVLGEQDYKHSRKTVDPITSREELAKALSKVAKGEDRAIVESYKSNVNLIKGETERANNLRKEIDEIKYKKSITYEGRELSVKEFEQIAYTNAEEQGIDAEKVKFKVLRDTGKYVAMVDGKKLLEAEKRFRSKEDIDKLATLEQNYNATLKRISGYDKKLLNIEAMSSIKKLMEREKKVAYNKAKAEGKVALKEAKEQAISKQKEITAKYQEARHKNVEGRRTTEMRHKLLNTVHTLDQLLVNPTKKKHIPIGLQKPIAEALNVLNRETDSVRMAESLARLKVAYGKILESDDYIIRNSHDEVIADMIDKLIDEVEDTPVREMNLKQLELAYNTYKALLKTVRDANKAFATAKGEEITKLADDVMSELETYERKNKAIPTVLDNALQLEWTNLKPTYAFERIGSSTFTELYNNIRHGEDVWAKDVNDARAFFDRQKKQYGFDKWDFKKKYAFTSKHGRNFELTLEQIMSIYAYTRRGSQAIEHLVNGGFVFDKHTVTEKKTKSGITYEVVFDDPKAYSLSEEIIGQINATLTNEQMGFVKAMQEYLSKTMGDKGNEVSRQLYDINLFGEENYFPLKTSEVYKERVREQARGEVKIKNKGFTKETTPHSTSPVVLTPFTDVWATHCIEMSMYHAFTLPLEDFYRVYNYKERADIESEEDGVTRRLEEAFGKSVTAYIDQLLVDVNGGTRGDPRASILDKALASFKKAKVLASLSVVVQQPSAIVRAMAYIDLKYFIDKPSKPNHKGNWEELKKYAPVAIIKEMGKFDVGVGQSTVDWIKNNPTLRDKIDEVVSKAPAYADEMGWISIWKAVKREVAATTNLKVNSEEFLQRCGERFTEVVSKTQVYDSVFSRSGYMRSKDTGAKMMTAFMAEPTTTLNILEDAVMKAIRGNPKFMARAITSCLASSLINSALVSVVYAMRDDDDEEYWKKYLSTLGETAIDNINPLNMIPYIKDIWSLVEGYRVSRSDLTLWQEIVWDINRLNKNGFAKFEDWVDVIASISQVTGIPFKNLLRDAKGIWNTAKSLIK